MLSGARLGEIIDDTGDAMFLNQWLAAKAFWNRQELIRTRERVSLALENCRAEADRREATNNRAPLKAHAIDILPTKCAVGDDACLISFVAPDVQRA